MSGAMRQREEEEERLLEREVVGRSGVRKGHHLPTMRPQRWKGMGPDAWHAPGPTAGRCTCGPGHGCCLRGSP